MLLGYVSLLKQKTTPPQKEVKSGAESIVTPGPFPEDSFTGTQAIFKYQLAHRTLLFVNAANVYKAKNGDDCAYGSVVIVAQTNYANSEEDKDYDICYPNYEGKQFMAVLHAPGNF